MQKRFVAYYRVSTDRQGKSGLGLDAQKALVRDYLTNRGWPPIKEFTEVESGRKADRPELAKALDHCRLCNATLVIAKIDRLARNAAFLLSLRDAGIEFVACDMPDANRLTVGIMAMVAEAEAERISTTTKQALAAAKARGTKLGGFKGHVPTDADRTKATAALRGKAGAHAARVAPVVAEIRTSGHTSLRAIAAELNARGIPSPRGGEWSSVAVMRLIGREARPA
jgi:DNA invertase Pin-like site-specific DNA recombinase